MLYSWNNLVPSLQFSLVLTTNANELQHYKIKHTFTIGEKHIWSRTRVRKVFCSPRSSFIMLGQHLQQSVQRLLKRRRRWKKRKEFVKKSTVNILFITTMLIHFPKSHFNSIWTSNIPERRYLERNTYILQIVPFSVLFTNNATNSSWHVQTELVYPLTKKENEKKETLEIRILL